jgi:hypothetical protein
LNATPDFLIEASSQNFETNKEASSVSRNLPLEFSRQPVTVVGAAGPAIGRKVDRFAFLQIGQQDAVGSGHANRTA